MDTLTATRTPFEFVSQLNRLAESAHSASPAIEDSEDADDEEGDCDRVCVEAELLVDSASISLDDFLAESVSIAATRKAQVRKSESRRFMDALPPLDHVPLAKWHSQFFCAIFVRHCCENCENVVEVFSHFAEYQTSASGSQWLKQTQRPEKLAEPRIITKSAPACSSCVSVVRAIPFGGQPSSQLLLFK